jgi:L-histidine Nalpha-methyltransferase
MNATPASNPSSSHASASTVLDRISAIVGQLKRQNSQLGFVLWEMRISERMGEVMDGIAGLDEESRYIKEGYQYAGGFAAHLWRLATVDDTYKTLSYGISNFHRHWRNVEERLKVRCHYVSIGPGTGEKDQVVLRYLQSLPGNDTIVYVPVDISPQLLRMGADVAMRGVDPDRVEALPIEMDITNDEALAGLRLVIDALSGPMPIVVSVLGNTLANFHDDCGMLAKIGALLPSEKDMLFLELATTEQASKTIADRAAREYRGSRLFREFAMATLTEYTDLTMKSGRVESTGTVNGDKIEVVTRFTAAKRLKVNVKNGDDFVLAPNEPIELYLSRKYTPKAVEDFIADYHELASHIAKYPGGFGITMLLLSGSNHTPVEARPHPVIGEQASATSE